MKARYVLPLVSAAGAAIASIACASAVAAPFTFSTGNPDGLIATGSRPSSTGKIEIESADDFVLTQTARITSASFTGLMTGGGSADSLVLEIYRVFPLDSNDPPSGRVPTRVNSPSDVAFQERSGPSDLSYSTAVLNPSFTATNSVLNGINPSPNEFTGGEGAVTGSEVRFDVALSAPFELPAGHYFFIPQVGVSDGDFLWLSAPKPITGGTGPFVPDLQSWIRNEDLAPDWLRIGTDITRQGPFNASFSLAGQFIPAPGTGALILIGLGAFGLAIPRRAGVTTCA